jgi:hypothetical protein
MFAYDMFTVQRINKGAVLEMGDLKYLVLLQRLNLLH